MTSEPQSPASGQPRLPEVVADRYRVVRLLGRGGMGAVYEAVHTWTGRRVALKVLLPHLASDPKAVERFRREARAAVLGAHPNIPDVLDMGTDPESGTLYLAQELLQGEDLAARLERDGALSLPEAYGLLLPVMDALESAHRAGVIHRDLKPANLFLAREESGGIVPRVVDFGIADLADAAPVTASGAPLGTPNYMSPEQARGERGLDARTDVWALGAVWFEALSGRRFVSGRTYHEVLSRLLAGPYSSLRAVSPGLPPGVCAAIDRALQPSLALRHPSMAAFARALLEAPGLGDAPWCEALRQRHPFAFSAPPSEPLGEQSPATLELPEGPESAPPDSLVGPPPPAPRASPESTPEAPPVERSASPPSQDRPATPWRAPVRAAVSLGLLLGTFTLWGLTRTHPSSRALPEVAPTPIVTADHAREPLPSLPSLPSQVVPEPVTPPSVVPLQVPSPSPTTNVVSSPRRPSHPRPTAPRPARDASVPQGPVVNGAPVLEP